MLGVAGVVCLGISAQHNFHERNVLSRHASCQGADDRLGKIVLGAEEDFLKAVIRVSGAVSGNVGSGLGKYNIISGTGDFQGQFVNCLKCNHLFSSNLICLNAI